MTDGEVHVRAAAFCAASWVRARRATWTDPEADPAAAFGPTTVVDFGMGGRFAVLGGPTQDELEEKEPRYLVTLAKTVASTLTQTLTKTLPEKARSLRIGGALRLGRRASTALVVAASVMSLAMIGREYWLLALRTPVAAKVREATVIAPPKTTAQAVDTSVGQLRITATQIGRASCRERV